MNRNPSAHNQKTASTDLAVMKAFKYNPAGQPGDLQFSRWLAEFSPRSLGIIALLFLLWPGFALAQSNYSFAQALDALWRWLPFVVGQGFLLNLVVSFLTMLVGTLAGVMLGLGQISPLKAISGPSWFITQLFRNSPWLVILFIVMPALRIPHRRYHLSDTGLAQGSFRPVAADHGQYFRNRTRRNHVGAHRTMGSLRIPRL